MINRLICRIFGHDFVRVTWTMVYCERCHRDSYWPEDGGAA